MFLTDWLWLQATVVSKMDNSDVVGLYTTSEGITGDDVWGTRGSWCTLGGAIEGEDLSLTVFDHPSNPGCKYTSNILLNTLFVERCLLFVVCCVLCVVCCLLRDGLWLQTRRTGTPAATASSRPTISGRKH